MTALSILFAAFVISAVLIKFKPKHVDDLSVERFQRDREVLGGGK